MKRKIIITRDSLSSDFSLDYTHHKVGVNIKPASDNVHINHTNKGITLSVDKPAGTRLTARPVWMGNAGGNPDAPASGDVNTPNIPLGESIKGKQFYVVWTLENSPVNSSNFGRCNGIKFADDGDRNMYTAYLDYITGRDNTGSVEFRLVNNCTELKIYWNEVSAYLRAVYVLENK